MLPARTKGVLQVGFPCPACRKFIGEYSQHQRSEVSRSGQREKLSCNEITVKTLADLSGSSGAGLAQSCPKLR